MKKIFVCSPYSGGDGDIEKNVLFAQEVCRALASWGFAPFAPHLFYTTFLDDMVENERAAGIGCGIEWLKACDEVWVFGPQSNGMKLEVILAENMSKPIKYLEIVNWEEFGKVKSIITEKRK